MINTKIILIVIVAIIILAVVVVAPPIHPTPNPTPYEGPPVTCYTCLENGDPFKWNFNQPSCPPGWREEPITDCTYYNPDTPDEPFVQSCKSAGENRYPDILTYGSGKRIPYELDTAHGCISKDLLEKHLRTHFNDWKDDPYTSTHCCRHMAMEIDEYLECSLGIDCLWALGEPQSGNPLAWHQWVYILVDDGKFHPYECTALRWANPTEYSNAYSQSGVFHGNYIYGKYRISLGENTIIAQVPNFSDFQYIEDNTATILWDYMIYEVWPNDDVVLPLSLYQMFTGQFVIGE